MSSGEKDRQKIRLTKYMEFKSGEKGHRRGL